MAAYIPESEETRGRRQLFVAVLFVLLSLTVVNLPPGPQQRMASVLRLTVLRPFIFTQETLARARVASDQAEVLQARLDSLVGVLSTQSGLREENRRLRELLEVSRRLGPSYVAASAMRAGTAGAESMFVLDVGAEDGVRIGAPVVVNAGLVGMIREVQPRSSIGMDWTHPDFRASAMTADGRVYGIVEPRRGEFREADRLLLNGIPFHADLGPGTEVLTSGLGGAYPRGIPVGIVEEVAEVEGRWRKGYWLRPAADPGSATHVLVALELADSAAVDVSDVWTEEGARNSPVDDAAAADSASSGSDSP